MITYFVASLFLVATVHTDDTDWLAKDGGRWLPVVVYPNVFFEPVCNSHIVTKADEMCVCGKKNDVPVFNLKNLERNRTQMSPVIIVDNTADITSALALNCTCNGEEEDPIALQKLDENTFATYAKDNGLMKYFGPTEPDFATVYVKNVTTLKELRDLIYSFNHLKKRKPGLLCEPEIFNKATSS